MNGTSIFIKWLEQENLSYTNKFSLNKTCQFTIICRSSLDWYNLRSVINAYKLKAVSIDDTKIIINVKAATWKQKINPTLNTMGLYGFPTTKEEKAQAKKATKK